MNTDLINKREYMLGRKADLLLQMGQMLTESLADSTRVNRSVQRIAGYLGFTGDNFTIKISHTVLILNLSDGEYSTTRLRRCTDHSLNMDMIAEISRLSWRVVREKYSLEQIEAGLNAIAGSKKHYKPVVLAVAAGCVCGGLCKLFGGDIASVGLTALAAVAGMYARQICMRLNMHQYITVILAAFIATLFSCAGSILGFTTTPHQLIASAVLFLTPGAPIINSINDMVDGFTTTGISRAVNATITVACITGGMIAAMYFFNIKEFGLHFHPEGAFINTALAAAMAATGFAMIFNVPKRILIVCALNGVLAIYIRNILETHGGLGLAASTFWASLAVGIACIYVRRKVRVPLTVIGMPAVIIMLPGVLLYKAMMGFMQINSEARLVDRSLQLADAIGISIVAGLTLLGLSTGIAFASLLGGWLDNHRWRRLIERAVD